MARGKGFKGNNPNERFVVDNKPMEDQLELTADQTDSATVANTEKTPVETPAKRKPGRPKTKTEPVRQINIAVPVSVLEKLETVKPCIGGNLTAHINKLIANDLEENYDKYMEFLQLFNYSK